MSDILCVHFQWVYTVSQRSVCYMSLHHGLVDVGIIVTFLSIIYIVWNSWLIIDIISFIHVAYITYDYMNRRHNSLSFYKLFLYLLVSTISLW